MTYVTTDPKEHLKVIRSLDDTPDRRVGRINFEPLRPAGVERLPEAV